MMRTGFYRWVFGVVLFGLTGMVGAQDAPEAPKEKKPKPELVDVSVSGVIQVTESEKKGKMRKVYTLESDGQTTKLPKPPKEVSFENFTGQTVTVSGKGFVRKKGDETSTVLKKVTAVTPQVEGGAVDEG